MEAGAAKSSSPEAQSNIAFDKVPSSSNYSKLCHQQSHLAIQSSYYVFNIEYSATGLSTLEFIQRGCKKMFLSAKSS
ncbi:hypothetical protein DPEC_G00296190 [Dallia pectoralis]|uniref:Uncharacterized protein n=1 Tax=Dallia pectoralis TaxID=75939 RepID=A0ACC2FIW8_DALPE|nr:hypothetical protein DPEC_G00296190 [Dallia pectoralis]